MSKYKVTIYNAKTFMVFVSVETPKELKELIDTFCNNDENFEISIRKDSYELKLVKKDE